MKRRLVLLLPAWIACGVLPEIDVSAQFPGLGDDNPTCLGQFEVVVNPLFQSFMTNLPGWNSATSRLWSPGLYDGAIIIGRSDPFLSGSAADTNGAPVGTAGTLVSEASFSLVPSGFSSAPGIRELHTEFRRLNLADPSGSGSGLRAGVASDQPSSPGEVESQSLGGAPANDFPANSFFDLFMDVDLPGVGTLTNGIPLVILAVNVTSLPPNTVYIHGNNLAVPLIFKTNNPVLGASAGDTFGLLMLGGIGVGMGTNDIPAFTNGIQNETEMQVEAQYRTWAPNLSVVPLLTDIIILDNGNLLIQGEGSSGRNYVLESTTSLSPPAWGALLGGVANGNGNFAFIIHGPLVSPQQFYRVRSH